jgi:hypothetical protein
MTYKKRERVYQIVPRLPPDIDGVGDYALNLARHLQLKFGIDTHFLIGDPNWTGANNLEGFNVAKVSSRSATSLETQLSQFSPEYPVLLHYAGYGYAERGCPAWLIAGLKRWKHQCKYSHLVTMFHETSASGPIWTSAFWLSTLQVKLLKQIVRLSDRILTSKQLYAEILQGVVNQQKSSQDDGKVTIPALPVFSNVGEPKVILPLYKRDDTIVVFGGVTIRSRVYRHHGEELLRICDQLNIKKIIDIGPNTDLQTSNIGNIKIEVLGSRPALEVSHVLSSAFAGLIDYPINFLGKSTVFASYCAHGLLPVVVGGKDVDADGLVMQKHYWFPNSTSLSPNMNTAQEIASNAYRWYQTHNLEIQAEQFVRSLFCN